MFDKSATYWIHGPRHLFPPLFALSRDGNWFRERRKRKRGKDEPWYSSRGIRSLDIYQPPALLGNSDRASSSWQRRERTQTRKLVEAALRHVSPSVSPDPNHPQPTLDSIECEEHESVHQR